MAYEWGWGYQPDEWIEDDWFDEAGNYHTVKELGGLRATASCTTEEPDPEEIPF